MLLQLQAIFVSLKQWFSKCVRVLTGGAQVSWQKSHVELMFNTEITFAWEQRNLRQ